MPGKAATDWPGGLNFNRGSDCVLANQGDGTSDGMTMSEFLLTRRMLMSGAGAVLLAGCSTTKSDPGKPDAKPGAKGDAKPGFMSRFAAEPIVDFDYDEIYGQMSDGGFTVPPVPWKKINERFLRRNVANTTGEKPGILVVETRQHNLYWTMPGGRAMRYGVGLGKAGFEWSGEGMVKRKAAWPRWHPPEEMIERKPELKKYSTTYDKKSKEWVGGMDGGINNPLGARALYIYQGEVDTQYRLHGSPEWNSIGKSVSSGCVRLINQDVIDLHRRVPENTRVIVR